MVNIDQRQTPDRPDAGLLEFDDTCGLNQDESWNHPIYQRALRAQRVLYAQIDMPITFYSFAESGLENEFDGMKGPCRAYRAVLPERLQPDDSRLEEYKRTIYENTLLSWIDQPKYYWIVRAAALDLHRPDFALHILVY